MNFASVLNDCEMQEYCSEFCHFLLTIAAIQLIYIIKDSVYNLNMNYLLYHHTAVGCNKRNSLNSIFKMCHYYYLDLILSILS